MLVPSASSKDNLLKPTGTPPLISVATSVPFTHKAKSFNFHLIANLFNEVAFVNVNVELKEIDPAALINA